MTDPTPLYPWSGTPEQMADDDRRARAFRKLVKTLRVGDRIEFDPERVIRKNPSSIRTIAGEMEHLGIEP